MINIPFSDIVSKIVEKTEKTEEEIKKLVSQKLEDLKGLISEQGAAHIIANELGVKLFEAGTSGSLQVKNILPGMRNVDLDAKVTRKYEARSFDTGERKGRVANFLVSDETGIIRVVLWNDQVDNFDKFKEGDVLKIKGGYVRENNGRKEIHLNDNSKLIVNPEGVEVEERGVERKHLKDLDPNDQNVEVLATIVQVFDPFYFEVCPKCRKRVRESEGSYTCQEHGDVSPDFNYVLNLYLDDGTNNVRTVFWSQQAEQLLEKSHADIVALRNSSEELEEIKLGLLGTIVKAKGSAKRNENFDRMEFVVSSVDKNPDPDEEMRKLKEASKEVVRESEASKEVKEKMEETIEDVDSSADEFSAEEAKGEVEEEEVHKPAPKEEKTSDVDEGVEEEDVISLDDLEDIEDA